MASCSFPLWGIAACRIGRGGQLWNRDTASGCRNCQGRSDPGRVLGGVCRGGSRMRNVQSDPVGVAHPGVLDMIDLTHTPEPPGSWKKSNWNAGVSWTPTSESLPPKLLRVLVAGLPAEGDKYRVAVGYRDHTGRWIICGIADFIVSYWALLPEPPGGVR